jgi:hypothetical protein
MKENVMPFQICFTVGSPPRKECRDIPVLIVRYPGPGPDPDPFFTRIVKAVRLVLGPSPEPWATGRLATLGLREETIRDARILATMDELSAKLSPSLGIGLAQSVQTAARELTLPQEGGVTIAA